MQKITSEKIQYIAMAIIALFFIGAFGLTYWQNIAIKKAASELVEKNNRQKHTPAISQ